MWCKHYLQEFHEDASRIKDHYVTWEKGWSADATTLILIDCVYVTSPPPGPIRPRLPWGL